MIIGLGSDLTDIRRIDKTLTTHDTRFTERCFTKVEREKSDGRRDRAASYAKRFAAKEACVKALGTGVAKGIFWQDIGVVNNELGKPSLHLSGRAAELLEQMIPDGHKAAIHLTLSDDFPWAQAFVIIEAVEKRSGK